MEGQINPKIVGATVIGFALVAGAYTISNFGESNFPEPQPANIQASAPQQREAIEVVDADQNGIEDWRDVFVDTGTFTTPQTNEPYTPPTTVTGKTGITLIEGIINSKLYAPFAQTKEEVVESTISSLDDVIKFESFDIAHLDVMEEWDDEDIKNYANTVAATIYRHNDNNPVDELSIVTDILRNNSGERVVEIEKKASVYKNIFEDLLKIPVPKIFTKEHLDLINAFQAVSIDVEAMTKILDDPLFSYLYMSRYSNDIEGMRLSLTNMYLALEDYADIFTVDDPAMFFGLFGPNSSSDYTPNN